MQAFHLIIACCKISYQHPFNFFLFSVQKLNLFYYFAINTATLRNIYFAYLFLLFSCNAFGQAIRQPIAARYIGLGAYSLNHIDAFSFTSNQAGLAQIKNTAVGVYGERRFLLSSTNFYSAVV